MSSVEELYEFIELFDISMNKQPHQYHVVPERVLQEFVSTTRARCEDLLDRDPFQDECTSMQYFLYMKEAQSNRRYPQLPRLNNALKLWLFQPRDKTALIPLFKKLTKDILTTRNVLVNRPNQTSIEAITNSFAKEFSSHFPDYYMVFTPYGSEMNGLAITPESRLNINIELDKADLDRLAYRDKNPFANDLHEPHCFKTSEIFKQQPVTLLDDKFNRSSIQLFDDIFIEYSFNTAIVTKGTHLIEEYMRLDGRVTPFLVALKDFAIRKMGGKCTYTFINMGIAYLLSLDPPVIPNLQNINLTDISDTCMDDDCLSKMMYWDYAIYQNEYIGAACRYHTCVYPERGGRPCKDAPFRDPSTKTTYWTSSNGMSVGELFLDCMHYYGYTFDYNIYAISIKHDGKTRRKPVFQGQPIVVEDPVLSGVNIAYQYNNQDKLRKQFQRAFVLLSQGTPFDTMMHTTSSTPLEDVKYKLLPRRRKALGQVRTCLLMGLPPNGLCDCEAIEKSVSQFASIENLQHLDKDVVLVSLAIREMVVLPFHVDIGGTKVHLVELFEVNQRREF